MANQRRSEKARNFLDLLRHSQLYEVFINERLALAAADFRTSDAFEAKVDFMLSKKGKVLGRLVAQASARGVSNLSAVLQRTSTLVKVSCNLAVVTLSWLSLHAQLHLGSVSYVHGTNSSQFSCSGCHLLGHICLTRQLAPII